MPVGDHIHPSYPRSGQRRRYGRGTRELNPIGKFASLYGLLLALSLAGKAFVFASRLEPVWLYLAAIHLSAGYTLNRYILTRVQWNPNFSTVSTLARAKVLTLLLWPVAYAILLCQLLIVRYL